MAGPACQAPAAAGLMRLVGSAFNRSSSDGVRGADPHEADRLAQSAEHRAILSHRSPLERFTRFTVGENRLRHDHLTAAALVLEARGGVDRGAEVIEDAAGSDRDAGAEVQAE